MILPDVNTLLYAVNRSSDQHAMALDALQRGFEDPRGVGFAWSGTPRFSDDCSGPRAPPAI